MGGNSAPWNDAGEFVIGTRDGQNAIKLNISSTDNGATFSGKMTYKGEGPIGFKAVLSSCNNTI